MTFRKARSLDVLLAEVDAAAPNRSTASDGWIGDAAHASRDSDHNPWVIDSNGVGVVRASDTTHDPAGGLDCNLLAAALEDLYKRGHPALGSGAYTIWRGRILSRDRISEGWRPYTGSNRHDHHLHQSVAFAAAGYDSTAPWGVMEEIDMPLTSEDLDKIARRVWDQDLVTSDGLKLRAGRILVQTHNRADLRQQLEAIEEELGDTATRDQVRRAREGIRAIRQSLAVPIDLSSDG